MALISAVPYVVAAVGMVVVGARSDRTGERRWHVAVPALVGALGFAAAASVPPSVVLSLTALSVAALGIWGALGPFWALPTAFLRGRAAAGGVALVNAVGNIGGFVGPTLVGYAREATGSFATGLWVLAAGLVAGARRQIAQQTRQRPVKLIAPDVVVRLLRVIVDVAMMIPIRMHDMDVARARVRLHQVARQQTAQPHLRSRHSGPSLPSTSQTACGQRGSPSMR